MAGSKAMGSDTKMWYHRSTTPAFEKNPWSWVITVVQPQHKTTGRIARSIR
jgi:hypothetical protein